MSCIKVKREFQDTSDNSHPKKSKKSIPHMFRTCKAHSQNHDPIWDIMAKTHNQNPKYNRTGDELKNKINNLKKSQYRTCKLLDDPTQWEFYNLMHGVIQKQNEDMQNAFETELDNPLETTEFSPEIDESLKLEFNETQDNLKQCSLLSKCDFLLEELKAFQSNQRLSLCPAALQLIFSKLSKLYDDYDNLQNQIMNSDKWDEALSRCLVTRDKEFKILYLRVVNSYSSMSS